MAKRIPFGWLPGHWGLSGKTRELAQIDYDHSDDKVVCERLRLQVLYEGDALIQKLDDHDLKHGKLSQKEYDERLLSRSPDSTSKAKDTLDHLLKHGEITQIEHDKEIATLAHEPWFHFDVDYINGELELKVDCNDLYIDYLRTVGYGNDSSASDDDVIYEYVRDFGRKLSEDHTEDDMNPDMMKFIKTQREAGDMVSKM